ncbi:MAG: ATP-grasp domain-containing protein [Dehalococcoidia bacterium]|jgi:D-alanine-D-alanine ligase
MSLLGHPTISVQLYDNNIEHVLSQFNPLSYIVFNWCEGIPGIDHSEHLVAQTLEKMGFAFTGASSETLAISGNKRRVKQLLEQAGIPTPKWRVFDRPEADGWNRFPAIVKAVNEHSSEGITPKSVVTTEAELVERISQVLETLKQPALVEDFIDGREFHVSIWGNGRIDMLPPVEMDFSSFGDFHDRLCTYDAKFMPGSPHYDGIKTLLPAPLSLEESNALEEACKASYTMLGCRDYGRIDVRIRDGIVYVLDVNPNADISSDASLACAAEIAGYSYGETGSHIVRLAAKRHPRWGNLS